ncbi:hypothetical protein BGZ68_005012 [Mortierella alpina]|nr:hypothetical protein BGZ68_005012 [Mortierella alpina]
MKRSHAILLAAIAALALISTTCARPMPEDADPAPGVISDAQEGFNQYPVCTAEATIQRDKCINTVEQDAKEEGESLTENYAGGCAAKFERAVKKCIAEFQKSSEKS